jgi:hypothetical protein
MVRKGTAEAASLLVFAALWVAVYGMLVATLYWLLPAPARSVDVISSVVVLVLPAVRVSLAPVAMAWNRHR